MGFRGVPMETCSSGEELTVKARKPYTITKQRERWTDEEHNRFLEALKLYGRAWQRIAEHIGTKTAVQIRSHAQKFFSKLEKEALSKGVPLGQALDIDIPPPRPKRKPSNPYPRKTCMGTIPSSKDGNDESSLPSIISSCQNTAPHLKNGACLETPVDAESSERAKEVSENGNCLEVLTLFQDAPCASVSSVKKNHVTPPSFRKFVPFLKEINHKLESDKASQTANENEELTQCTADCTDLDIGRIKRIHINSQTKVAPMKMSPGHRQPHEVGILSNGEENNETSGHCANFKPSNVTASSSQADAPVYSIPPLTNPSLSATPEYSTHPPLSSFHPELPAFPPFTPFHNNQEAYRSLLNNSSTFSNFIMSTLIQNPAAHSAACLAASFWPSVDGEIINTASEALNSGILQRQVNVSPNMATIAAATVAAATAWWATHGLFPFCHPPLSTGFSFASTPSATGPTVNNQSPEEKEARKDDRAQLHRFQDEHILDPESPDALVMQRSSSKSLPLTSSDSDVSGGGERLGGIELNASDARELDLKHDTGFHDYGNKAKSEKKLDSCSCGSNKSSSNERETKIVLEKDEENKEPMKQASFSETNWRRFRSSGSANESWKEVSEEGRLAFQALFSREVLPQSFSPPAVEDGTTNLEKERVATAPPVNLNSKFCEDIVLDRVPGIESSSSRSDNHSDKSILTSESGYAKLKSNRTGFKPYKRCSMEAKESRATIGDEKNNKRPRLEGEASTR